MNVQVFEKLPGTTPMYETIFHGSLSTAACEEIKEWFHVGTPPECTRQTLSQNVVCQVESEENEEPKYYLVNSEGWEELSHFSMNAVLPMKGVRMLVIEPGKEPRAAIVGDDLRSREASHY